MIKANRTLLVGALLAGLAVSAAAQMQVPGQGEEAVSESHEGPRSIISAIPGVPKIFLPDIGVAGDFAYERDNLKSADPRYDPTKRQPRIRDGQIVMFSPIDPFTNAQFTVDLPETGPAVISEAWVYFKKLPTGATARVGRFAPVFGLINPQNTFQLATLDRPYSIGNYLGAGGLTATGAALDDYIPNPWDLNVKANFTVARGDILLTGTTNTSDLAYMGTLDYSTDLMTSGSLQSGVSVGAAPSPFGGSETLIEPYAQVIYQRDERHVWTISGEGIMAERQYLGNQNFKAGFYVYADYGFALRYHVGMLVDVADLPGAPSGLAPLPTGRQLSLSPNATWFVSDNTRLRLAYTHQTALGTERPNDKVSFQLTFSLGNLKQMQ